MIITEKNGNWAKGGGVNRSWALAEGVFFGGNEEMETLNGSLVQHHVIRAGEKLFFGNPVINCLLSHKTEGT